MAEVSNESFKALLDRVGLNPTPEDVRTLKRIYEQYLDKLALLHSVDLRNEEVAGVFSPVEEARP